MPCRSLLALAAIVCVYNLPQLLSGTVQFDGVDVHYSAQRYLSDELHAGRLPFWTPYIFSGFPFLADVQVGAWYPLNWPFFFVGITPRTIGGELLVSSLVACSGAYFFARRFLRSEAGCIVAAMCYGLSGWFAAHSQHVGMVASAAWLPWLLVCLLRLNAATRHPAEGPAQDGGPDVRLEVIAEPRRLLELGLVGAAVALPGSFQIALYTFSFVGIWAVCEACAERSWHSARRLGLGLAAAVVWGAALSAVMILPGLELVSRSVRTQLRVLDLPDVGYFHPSALATLVDPDYYGLLSGHYAGPGDSTQHYFYAGILLVPLAVLGARHRRVLRTAAALSLPFAWYALGPRAGIFDLAARLPGFSSVELPMHGWFLPALGLALLGGAGADVVARRFGARPGAALVGVLLLDVLIVNQLLNPLAYARESFDDLYGRALAAFDVEARAANPPIRACVRPAPGCRGVPQPRAAESRGDDVWLQPARTGQLRGLYRNRGRCQSGADRRSGGELPAVRRAVVTSVRRVADGVLRAHADRRPRRDCRRECAGEPRPRREHAGDRCRAIRAGRPVRDRRRRGAR